MNKLRIIILSSLLAGCSPFPIHYSCDTPKFTISDKSKDISYFSTNGYFEKSCSTEVPEKFTYWINEYTNITIRVRGEWIDLKPSKYGAPFKLKGKDVRELNYEGYTQAARVDSSIHSTLTLWLTNSAAINIKFNFVRCACVTYDAI